MPADDRTALQASHLQRFGVIAATSVIVLLVTGAANSVAEISTGARARHRLRARVAGQRGISARCYAPRPPTPLSSPAHRRGGDEGRPADDLRRRMNVAVRVELLLGVPSSALPQSSSLPNLPPDPRRRGLRKSQHVRHRRLREQQPTGGGPTDIAVDLTVSPNAPGQKSFRASSSPRRSSVRPSPARPARSLR